MVSFEYEIKDPLGMHARPAAVLATIAKESRVHADVMIHYNGKTADASQLIQVMALGIGQGSTVQITVEGDGEQEVAQKVEEFFKETM